MYNNKLRQLSDLKFDIFDFEYKKLLEIGEWLEERKIVIKKDILFGVKFIIEFENKSDAMEFKLRFT